MNSREYFTKLALLLGQEAGRNPSSLELRADHLVFMKSIGEYVRPPSIDNLSLSVWIVAKMFEHRFLDHLLPVLEPLLIENDRYKQRAAAELLAGFLRGE